MRRRLRGEDGNRHFGHDDRPGQRVDGIADEPAALGLQHRDDGPAVPSHVLERLFVLRVDVCVEGRAGHFVFAGRNNENRDDVRRVNDLLRVVEGLVEAAGLGETLMLEVIDRPRRDDAAVVDGPGLRGQIGKNILIKSPEAERIARMHLAARGVQNEIAHGVGNVGEVLFHRSRSVHDDKEAVGGRRCRRL